MTKVQVYNQEGKTLSEMEVSEKVFHVEPKSSVIHQVYNAILANARIPWADTKGRGEVSGGGKKPWKQKGTGRARHGSTRSPIWKGGGVTFGPRSVRSFKQKINKKMNRKAVAMCLSEKLTENKLIVLDTLAVSGKTKEFINLRKNFEGTGKTTMFLVKEKDENLVRASKNLAKCTSIRAIDVNVVDLLNTQYIIATKESIEVLEKRLG